MNARLGVGMFWTWTGMHVFSCTAAHFKTNWAGLSRKDCSE